MFEYQLQYDSEKYLITKSLYTLLITETNYISDYGQCRRFVRTALSKYAKEVQTVKDFGKKRRDIIEL
jgi:hypothetical protein